nr:MAG TPA: hypothetical protein [Caudoviricetes sp.]
MHHRKPLRKNRNNGTRKNKVNTTNEISHLQSEFVIVPQKSVSRTKRTAKGVD